MNFNKSLQEIEEDLVAAYLESEQRNTDRWHQRYPTSINGAMEWIRKKSKERGAQSGVNPLLDIPTQEWEARMGKARETSKRVAERTGGKTRYFGELTPEGKRPDAQEDADLRMSEKACWTEKEKLIVKDSGNGSPVQDEPLVIMGADLTEYQLTEEESRHWRARFADDPSLLEDPARAEEILASVMAERKAQEAGTVPPREFAPLPGAVGQIAAWTQAAAYRMVPMDICVVTAIAAMSAGVAHRAVVDWDSGPTALNIEGLIQMGSSVGKEGFRTTVKGTSAALGGATVVDDPPSKEGLHRAMLENPNRALCVMIDEYGKAAEAVSTGSRPNLQAAIEWSMKAYGLPFGRMEARSVKDPKKSLDPIENPYLCGLHTTPGDLGQGLKQEDIYGGLLGRKLYIRGPDYADAPPRGRKRVKDMPEDLKATLKAVEAVLMPLARDEQGKAVSKAAVGGMAKRIGGRYALEMTEVCEDVFYDWRDKCEARFKNAGGDPNPLWGRVPAMTISIAGLIALGDVEDTAAPNLRRPACDLAVCDDIVEVDRHDAATCVCRCNTDPHRQTLCCQ